MRCCVPFCKTTAEIVSECENIAFHEFPNEAPVRAAWLRALGKQDTLLPDPAVVCSQHFLSDDIYETESGSRRIRTGAIPSTVQVCMICFDTHSKLYPMRKYKLEEAYERLVGHPVCAQGNLRQAVCVQCAQRLVNFSKFRDKSLRARALMMELVGKHELITIRHVKSISRAKHQLESGIVKTVLEPDRCDVHVAHCDAGRPTAPSAPAVSVDSAITAANSADNSTDSFSEHLRAYNEGYFDDVAVKSEDGEPAQPPTQCESSALCCDDDGSIRKQKSSEHCDQALVAAMAASPGTRRDTEQRPTEEADTTGTFAPSGVATNDESKEHPTDINDELDILYFFPNRIVVEDARNPQDPELKPEELLPETANSISCRTTRRSELRTNQRMDTDYSEIKSENSQNSILDTQLAKPEDRIQYICDVCQKIFQRKTVLVIHMRSHTGEKPFACKLCDYKCAVNSDLVNHMRNHTGEKPFACKLCIYKCKKNSHLVTHMRTHTGERPFACKLCNYKCTVNSSLVIHMRTHTGERPFACKSCNYKCTQSDTLLTHMRTHTGEKPFACKLCDFKSSRKTHLVSHMRTHTGERPFACKLCDYKCSQKSSLVNHMRNHTGEKPFACKLCDYKCKKNIYLVTHMRTHTGERPFACKLCDYKCSQKSNLVSHMRTHTGERPFVCKLCNYKCTKNSSLVSHTRIHTGERPFACKLCNYKGTENSSLVTHMRTHTGERPFACKLCNYKGTVNSSLVTHMRTHTGEKP